MSNREVWEVLGRGMAVPEPCFRATIQDPWTGWSLGGKHTHQKTSIDTRRQGGALRFWNSDMVK